MPENCQSEEVDEKAIQNMNQYIDQVEPKDIQLAKPVIEGKGEIHYGPGFKNLLNRTIIAQVSDCCLFFNL